MKFHFQLRLYENSTVKGLQNAFGVQNVGAQVPFVDLKIVRLNMYPEQNDFCGIKIERLDFIIEIYQRYYQLYTVLDCLDQCF